MHCASKRIERHGWLLEMEYGTVAKPVAHQ